MGIFACYFLLTLVVEVVVAVPLLRRVEEGRGRRVAAVALANLASHPLAWFALIEVPVVAESWAFVSEAAIYLFVFRGLRFRRAAGISALANALSCGAGLLLALIFDPHGPLWS